MSGYSGAIYHNLYIIQPHDFATSMYTFYVINNHIHKYKTDM